jgi:predicted amidophosphoribosyltransferase
MNMFFCAICEEMRDSDDGAEEYEFSRLMCAECASDMEVEEARACGRCGKPSDKLRDVHLGKGGQGHCPKCVVAWNYDFFLNLQAGW